MDPQLAGLVTIGLLIGLMITGVPVAFAFLSASAVGMLILIGGAVSIIQLAANMSVSVAQFVFVPIPLFLLMGELFFHTGVAARVFDAFDALLGRIPGRLSYLTVANGTMFAALTGTSMGSTAMLGSLMVPEMTRRGYARKMAMGPILGTGGLAILIPPSGLAVLLGSIAKVDIGALLLGGILPGLVLAMLYVGLITGQIVINPSLAPQYDVPPTRWTRKLRLLITHLLPMGLVVFMVIGLMLMGVATPTEAAAFGVLGVLILAAAFRLLTFGALWKSMIGTLKVTAMVLVLVMASSAFSQILALSGLTSVAIEWVQSVQVAPLMVIMIMFGILLLMGMFMDQVSMMLLSVPVFFPIAQALGFDLVWFAVIVLLSLEIAGITPPFGLNLYVMMGVAPNATLGEVSLAAAPYVVCNILLFFLILMIPPLALYLPSLTR